MSDESSTSPTIHIRKLCVGVETIEDLEEWQRINLPQRGGKIWHVTRSWPKRANEILENGGSIYWIIKGSMCVRQPIIGFEEHPSDNPDDKPKCRILFAPELIRTQPWPHRPFQGWRYLQPKDAPPDLTASELKEDAMPAEMIAELKTLGLL